MVMDVILALRGIRRNPGFAALVIGTMAIGIGANTTMYSVVRAVFLRPLPYSDEDRLVTLWEQDSTKGITDRRVTPANFVDWRAQSTAFDAVGVLPNWSGSSWRFNIVGPEGTERVNGIYASSGFFQVLGVRPLFGRTFAEQDDRLSGQRHAVIGYRYWQERFGGNRNVIGETIHIDTFRGGAFQIVGVLPPGFDLPHKSQIWLSLGDWGAGPMPALDITERCCNWYTVFAKLKPGVNARQAASELTGIARRIGQRHPTAAPVTDVRVIPLRETLVGSHRLTLFALFAAVGCILLIGCANVASLFLSRGIGRHREILTRRALGAMGWRIARQLMVEGVVLAVAGALAGFGLSVAAQPLVTRFLSERVPLAQGADHDWTVLCFVAAVTLACGVFCGLAPLAASRRASLANRGQTEGALSRNLRTGLVVGEIALAAALSIAAGLLIRTVANLDSVDLRFSTEHLLTVSTDLTTGPLRSRGSAAGFLEQVLARIAVLPGVRMAAATTALPFETGMASQAITREDRTPQSAADSPQVIQVAVTPEYFRAMGMQLRAGRPFAETDRAEGKLVAILNETAARRYWSGEDPIGKRFAIGSRDRFGSFRPPPPGGIEWREIVGVVSDIRSAGQIAPIEPEVYYSYHQFPIYSPSLIVRTEAQPLPLAAAVRREIEAVSRNAVVTDVRTMDAVAAQAIADPTLRAQVVGGLSLLAVVLGMLGVYGLMTYSVTQRTREIGIRMALGAREGQVMIMVMRRAIALTAAGLALGLTLAIAAARWLTTLLFGVKTADPVTMVVAVVLLAGASVAASFVPARRAARVDPAMALRSE